MEDENRRLTTPPTPPNPPTKAAKEKEGWLSGGLTFLD